MNRYTGRAAEILHGAAWILRTTADALDKKSTTITTGCSYNSDLLADGVQDVTNMIANLRLDLFVKYASLCAQDDAVLGFDETGLPRS